MKTLKVIFLSLVVFSLLVGCSLTETTYKPLTKEVVLSELTETGIDYKIHKETQEQGFEYIELWIENNEKEEIKIFIYESVKKKEKAIKELNESRKNLNSFKIKEYHAENVHIQYFSYNEEGKELFEQHKLLETVEKQF